MRQFNREELALIQTALHTHQVLLRDSSKVGSAPEREKTRSLMNEIQSHLLTDQHAVLTPTFLTALRNTKSAAEWSALCKGVVPNSNGDYPPDWFEKVMASGLQAEACKNWEKETGPEQCSGCNHYRVTVDPDTGFCRECVRTNAE